MPTRSIIEPSLLRRLADNAGPVESAMNNDNGPAPGLASPASWPRRRVAVVVQRYGAGLLGGAEWHALSHHHDVTVLTSCARDAMSWAMHYAPGDSTESGVRVRRFAHPPRHTGGRAKVPLRHKLRFLAAPLLDVLKRTRAARPRGDDRLDGHEFLRRQGPWCEGLIDALKQSAGQFDAVIFFTALYHPTAEGLPAWGARSVLVPTLHDEKAMVLPWFHRVFAGAGHVVWNTAAEQRLAHRLYGSSACAGSSSVVGAAVQARPPSLEQLAQARQRYGLPARYLVYVGRVEVGKGCAELLAAWRALGASVRDAALVFVGHGGMKMPDWPNVTLTGFIDSAERDALVAGAAALVMPSRHESLSLVLLEAMALGVPVVANGRCEPLLDHVFDSGAGEVYRGQRELSRALLGALVRDEAARRRMGDAGRAYVSQHYADDVVHGRWLHAVEQVCVLQNGPS
jgi:glycosyltransferase involved in cell wall biosynthesis